MFDLFLRELQFSYFHSKILIIMKSILLFIGKDQKKYSDEIRGRKWLKFELILLQSHHGHMYGEVTSPKWMVTHIFFRRTKLSTLVFDLLSKRIKRLITICIKTVWQIFMYANLQCHLLQYSILQNNHESNSSIEFIGYSNQIHRIYFKYFKKEFFFTFFEFAFFIFLLLLIN